MIVDLQKAGIWKRMAAWMLDLILLGILAVGIAIPVSYAMGYDRYNDALTAAYAQYEAEYGIQLDVTPEEYEAFTEAELAAYDACYNALIADEEFLRNYNMVINQSLLMASISLLLGVMVVEFVIPLILGNGQTVGKKVFSLGVIRIDGVRVTPLQMFVRALLGKFTIGTMIPVYLAIMAFFGIAGIYGVLLIGAIAVLQVILLAATRNNSAIHDLLAGTVVVDIASQQIFKNTDDLIAYTKRIHAEQAARKDY